MTDETTLDLMPDTPLPDEPPPEQQSAPAEKPEAAAPSESVDAPAEDPNDGKDAAAADTAEQPAAKRNRTTARERIGQLTKQVRDLERALSNVGAKTSVAPPRQEDFNDYGEFLRAQARHEAAATFDAREAERLAGERERAAREAQALAQSDMQGQIAAARERHADFEEVAFNPAISITNEMAGFLRHSDHFADLAYHLGKNPAVAARIAAMPALEQVKALTRLEDRISAPPPSQKTTKAPPPPPTVSGSSGAGKDPSRMSYEDYKRFRMGK